MELSVAEGVQRSREVAKQKKRARAIEFSRKERRKAITAKVVPGIDFAVQVVKNRRGRGYLSHEEIIKIDFWTSRSSHFWLQHYKHLQDDDRTVAMAEDIVFFQELVKDRNVHYKEWKVEYQRSSSNLQYPDQILVKRK